MNTPHTQSSTPGSSTLLDKIWESHQVRKECESSPAILYIDRHLIHEVTSPQAFEELRKRQLRVRRTDRTLATIDHSIPTRRGDIASLESLPWVHRNAALQVEKMQENCAEFGIELYGLDSPYQGIVHVIGPELGATWPGSTVVCGDSHTSTHGAFGALAFGIGTTEVAHVLATQCLMQRKPKSLSIQVSGSLGAGVSAKDLILAMIGEIGVQGGTGHVIEYRGSTIQGLSIEERMTVCNMSIEAGARGGLIAPDEITFDALRGTAMAPKDFDRAVETWSTLRTDPDARFDSHHSIQADRVRPMVTWGTDPSASIPIDEVIPNPVDEEMESAQKYMGVRSGTSIAGLPISMAFIGSCTNGRLSDLRIAAQVLAGRTVHPGVELIVVPGSTQVKRAAEAEGLDQVFQRAGAQWRHSGCSLCIAMNGDKANPFERVISTSNRNFEGRQGPGSRTVLASPATVAASAIYGCIADPREVLEGAIS